jgi:hypothetical protein
MNTAIAFVAVVFVLVFVATLARALHVKADGGGRGPYRYAKRDSLLSRAEHECYDALIAAVGANYYVFAQVHLSSIVNAVGQGWFGARSHIDRKSVDFVLCDKAYIAPRLAIELDDKTHERPDRQERDREVERILEDVGMPLLRLENHGRFDPSELAQRIRAALEK